LKKWRYINNFIILIIKFRILRFNTSRKKNGTQVLWAWRPWRAATSSKTLSIWGTEFFSAKNLFVTPVTQKTTPTKPGCKKMIWHIRGAAIFDGPDFISFCTIFYFVFYLYIHVIYIYIFLYYNNVKHFVQVSKIFIF
jgi:hypothetical protein